MFARSAAAMLAAASGLNASVHNDTCVPQGLPAPGQGCTTSDDCCAMNAVCLLTGKPTKGMCLAGGDGHYTFKKLHSAAPCRGDGACKSGKCKDSHCMTADHEPCEHNSECASGVCEDGRTGTFCESPSRGLSGSDPILQV